MAKSYITIREEIEELKARGFDEKTIESVLQAKYRESNIQRIYTEAEWEEENVNDKEEQRKEAAVRVEEGLEKTGAFFGGILGVVISISAVLFLIFFVFPAIDGCFNFVEAISEIE